MRPLRLLLLLTIGVQDVVRLERRHSLALFDDGLEHLRALLLMLPGKMRLALVPRALSTIRRVKLISLQMLALSHVHERVLES